MKVLVTGANGFLGQHLVLHLVASGFDVVASGRGACKIPVADGFEYRSLELTNRLLVDEAVQAVNPAIIMHTAAMSKPDECDRNRDACILNNVTVTEHLVHAANRIGARLVYVSTDFVFGEGGPHAEGDEPAPLNFYGESKWIAERLVAQYAQRFAIMRPVFIYGKIWEGIRPTFLHWVKHNLEQGNPIKVVSDQLRTPTHVHDLCRGLEAMINRDVTGIYHLAGREILSPYQMAMMVAEVLGLDSSLIESVTAETFHEPVKRAKHSGLKIDKARKELGYEPMDFKEGVKEVFA